MHAKRKPQVWDKVNYSDSSSHSIMTRRATLNRFS